MSKALPEDGARDYSRIGDKMRQLLRESHSLPPGLVDTDSRSKAPPVLPAAVAAEGDRPAASADASLASPEAFGHSWVVAEVSHPSFGEVVMLSADAVRAHEDAWTGCRVRWCGFA